MLLTEALGIGLSQAEADFVIPDLDHDRPLCIDPFLLFKSRDQQLKGLHDVLVSVFNRAFEAFRSGSREELDTLIDFPEVREIGLGYTQHSVRGSGMGSYLNRLVAETLTNSPPLLERGIGHVEELQLVSLRIGPDRVSDMAANVLKQYLLGYSQRQAELWGIPLTKGVPIHHVFDPDAFDWIDVYADLPTNPINAMPIILVPRRIVRLLPWLNYDDFERSQFRMFLQSRSARSLKNRLPGSKAPRAFRKEDVIQITRQDMTLIDEYVRRKEASAAEAQPQLYPGVSPIVPGTPTPDEFIRRLDSIPTGREHARRYQTEMLAILQYLFEPELTDGKIEERTIHGTERRDIIFTNESDTSFWQYARQSYRDYLVMFEAKNVAELTNEHIAQTATYMGDRLGFLAFILTRRPSRTEQVLKTFSVFNDSSGSSRKVIIILSDEDAKRMIQMRAEGTNSTRHVQQKYREFKVKCQ